MGMTDAAMEVRDASAGYAPQVDRPVVPEGYKQTEVGVIPEEWCVVKLGSFISLQRGHDLTWRERRRGEVPVMGAAGQNGFHDTAIAKGPGVVLGRSGASFGQAHYSEHDYWPYNTALYVTDFQGNDPLFVFYFLTATDFSRHNSGGAQQSLNRNFIAQIPIGVPLCSEQCAIASALSDVDALLESLDCLITKKRDIKQATMQQLLTGETRLPGFEGEWEKKALAQLGEFLKGSGVNRNEALSGHLPCVRYGEIYTLHDDIVRGFYSWVSGSVAEQAVKIKKGDVLFAGSGETKEEIGKSVALIDDVEAYAGGDILVLRTRTADPAFLGYALNQPSVRLQKSRFGQGDAVVHINASSLSQVTVCLPPLDEQEAISVVLREIDTELEVLEQRRAKTAALKQAMMQELLTGRTRLI